MTFALLIKLLARNLPRHKRVIHSGKSPSIDKGRHHRALCIGGTSDMYLVSKNLKGPGHPIHVQKRTFLGNAVSTCELSDCLNVKQAAARSFLPSFECDHILSVAFADSYFLSVTLKDESLTNLVERQLFSESQKSACLALSAKAEKENCPAVVSTLGTQLSPSGSRYVFFLY